MLKTEARRIRRKMLRPLMIAMLALVGAEFGAPSDAIAYSTVVLPNPGGEPSLATPGGILDQLYGLGNVSRVDDALDQKWFNLGIATVVPKAKYAGYSQTFGYVTDGNAFIPLISIAGGGLLSGLSAQFTSAQSGTSFGWGDDPNGTQGAPALWRDVETSNADGLDHMVTYLIIGSVGHSDNHVGAYVIAFEDLQGGGDLDYNDLVVEVRGVVDAPSVPAPAALLLLLAGVGAAGLRALRRRVRPAARA